MAAITWTNVTDAAPELAAFSNVNAQNAVLNEVNTTINVVPLGGEDSIKTFNARVYLAAHIATLLRRRGIAGVRSSESAGPVSESFSPILLPQYGAYAMTSYGVLYAQEIASTAHRAGFLVGANFGRGIC